MLVFVVGRAMFLVLNRALWATAATSICVSILAVGVKVDLEGFSLQKSNPYFLYPKK